MVPKRQDMDCVRFRLLEAEQYRVLYSNGKKNRILNEEQATACVQVHKKDLLTASAVRIFPTVVWSKLNSMNWL